jgi:glycine cleavage system H protein
MNTAKPAKAYRFPDDRHYDGETHMWAKRETAVNQITIGIDTLGLEALGELAYVSLQAVGMPVKRGDSIGVMEAAKMTGDVIAPVSGILVARNEPIMRDPGIVNDDPYNQGWLVTIEPHDWETEAAMLVSGAALPAWIKTEIERYRDQGWID